MSRINCSRPGCRDVFHAFLVEHASYDGFLEIPIINPITENRKPKHLIVFSKAVKSSDYNSWVHFYEDDAAFERIWNNPRKYLPILQKYKGVITPDFSLYRDMPLVMQFWNIYRSRAIGKWLQDNGVNVIVNTRFGDERTYKACCYGVPKNSIISIGTHGCIRIKDDKQYLIEGLDYVINTIHPKIIIVYGAAPNSIFEKYKKLGIEILQFDSDYAISRGGDA
ncbi:MAG: DUF4417 domain-containing protein [Lachnospiraceae bacterium]|nr:DUF4417 domain-containing protein [Lachnospiraceae bacterium]